MPTNDSTPPDWASDTNFTSGPYSGSPTKVEPTSGEIAQGFVPGAHFFAGWVNFVKNKIIAWLADTNRGYYGNGADGAITLGAGTTTLTRDMYPSTLTVPNGSTLETAGHKIFVSERCTIGATGIIQNNGGNGGDAAAAGVGGTAGAAATGVTLGAGFAGGAGNSNANGVAGTNATPAALGGAGGAGGDANDSGRTGGAGGTTTLASIISGYRHLAAALGFTDAGVIWRGGAGGGGGAGGDTGAGGGGGGGGGIIFLAAYTLEHAGTIRAHGGDGGDAYTGPDALGNAGGGGGGGGVIWLIYRGRSGAGTVTASGGAGGAGFGLGDDGVAGSAGTVVTLTA